jgi:transcriptional regulator with XRE-family HTH domain
LRRARQEKGITQEELGYRSALHRTEISLLERGRREPRLGTLVKLATALDTTPQVLCEGIHWQLEQHRFKVDPLR